MDFIFVVARIVLGFFFINSGVMHFLHWANMVGYAQSKKVLAPKVAVAVTGLVLIAGGLGIVLWKYLALGSGMLSVFLIVSAIWMHNFWSEQDAGTKNMQMIQFMKNIALAASLVLVAIIGTGSIIL